MYHQVCKRDQEIPNLRTEFMERISVKFSLIESTVDRIEGSKNPATCFLCVCTDEPSRTVRVNNELPG